jgi:hypothetical protein
LHPVTVKPVSRSAQLPVLFKNCRIIDPKGSVQFCVNQQAEKKWRDRQHFYLHPCLGTVVLTGRNQKTGNAKKGSFPGALFFYRCDTVL